MFYLVITTRGRNSLPQAARQTLTVRESLPAAETACHRQTVCAHPWCACCLFDSYDSCKKEVARQALTVGESTRGRNSLPQADCLRAPLVRLLPVR
ncbi:MAG: hypothetical protein RR115_09085, partial [Hydrogenoanaerobacterium sp.]